MCSVTTLAQAFLVKKFHLCENALIIRIRTCPLLGMPPRYHDAGSRSSPSWYQKDWKSTQVGGSRTPEGCREWERGDSRGHTAETGSASSSGKKHKCPTWVGTKEKILNIPPADLWSVQKILHDKRGSLSQTYKKNTEGNAKLYDFDQKTMQA